MKDSKVLMTETNDHIKKEWGRIYWLRVEK